MEKKHTYSRVIGIAFVGFITQLGGGFASGAQIYQYFINYGIWAFLMPILPRQFYHCNPCARYHRAVAHK